MKKVIYLIFAVTSCNNSIQKKEKANCITLVNEIIKSSNYNNPMFGKNVSYWVDTFEDTIIRVKVCHSEDSNQSATAGWIEIFPKKKKIFDVTIDPQNPIIIDSFSMDLMLNLTNCNQ